MGTQARGHSLTRLFRRLTATNDELLADERQRAVADCGATPVGECRDREDVVLSGTISSLTVVPKQTMRLEADLDDGSGQVKLVWMGRREIRGIEAGTVLQARGRISCRGRERVMYNPGYEIVSVPG